MRIAAVYDVHANLPALEAVLADIDNVGVDLIVIGGDVLPGPMPRETLSALRSLKTPTQSIMGNGETDTIATFTGADTTAVPEQARAIIQWTARALSQADIHFIQSWPQNLRISVPRLGDVYFCHATPRSDREIFTERTPENVLIPIFEATGAAVVVCGHTHMQFDRTIGSVRVVNAGSVGMPFGDPGAYWLLLGSDIELRRTLYDVGAAGKRIEATNYPDASRFVEANIKNPPPASQMVDVFERVALR